jgi:hypothetical protein
MLIFKVTDIILNVRIVAIELLTFNRFRCRQARNITFIGNGGSMDHLNNINSVGAFFYFLILFL